MKKLAELKAALAEKKAAALKLLDAVEASADGMSEKEEAAYAALKSEIDDLQSQIARAEKLAEERRSMAAIPSAALATTVHDLNPVTTGGFRDLGEFAVAVRGAFGRTGIIDQRLLAAPTNVHQGGASSGEGFEVPPQFRDEIFEVVTELDEFGPLVDEEPTEKRQVEYIADESTPWGATGVQARWRSEADQMTPSKLVTDPRSVPLHELYAFVLATGEMLEDAPRLRSRLTRKAGAAISWKRNESMMFGSGAGQPMGWMSGASLISVAKETGQAADTIVTQNVIKMFSRLMRVPGDKPVWLANPDTLPQLMTMTLGDKPIWMPPNGLVDAPGGILLGAPVRLSEHCTTVGDLGDLQLLSPKGYYALRRESGPQFAESIHLYFDYNLSAFRWMFRFGGQPYLSAAVAPAKGAATKSHFVALAARA